MLSAILKNSITQKLFRSRRTGGLRACIHWKLEAALSLMPRYKRFSIDCWRISDRWRPSREALAWRCCQLYEKEVIDRLTDRIGSFEGRSRPIDVCKAITVRSRSGILCW